MHRRNNRTVVLPQRRDPAIGGILFLEVKKIGRGGFTFLNPVDTGTNLRPFSSCQIKGDRLRQDTLIRGKTRNRSGINLCLELVSKANKEIPASGSRGRPVAMETDSETLDKTLPLLPSLCQRREEGNRGAPG